VKVVWQDIASEVLGTLGITLSVEQAAAFWSPARITLIGGGERGGKTFISSLKALCYSIALSLTGQLPEVLVWFVGAEYKDARASWESPDQLISWLRKLGMFSRDTLSMPQARDEPCYLITRAITMPDGRRVTPIRFETVSGHDPRDIGRVEPHVISGEELGRWPKELWDRCYGRLAANYGTAIGVFSGSFESDQQMFAELFDMGAGPNTHDIQSFPMPSWANRQRYPAGRHDPAIADLESSMSPERFMERHGGRPAPPTDSVFPEFRTILHVRQCDMVMGEPVYLAIDPAKYVYAVEFVQPVGGEVHVLDEVYLYQTTHEQVIAETVNRPLWRYVTGGVIDCAGERHPFGLMSAAEAWRRDTGLTLSSQYLKLDQTIERVRSTLSISPITHRPRLAIAPTCRGMIAEFGGGPSPIPRGGRWRMQGKTPRTDNCDAVKALGYLLSHLYGTLRLDFLPEPTEPVTYLTQRPMSHRQANYRSKP
jgi:hypothetical protein